MILSYVIDTLIQVYECLLSRSRFVLNHNVQNKNITIVIFQYPILRLKAWQLDLNMYSIAILICNILLKSLDKWLLVYG